MEGYFQRIGIMGGSFSDYASARIAPCPVSIFIISTERPRRKQILRIISKFAKLYIKLIKSSMQISFTEMFPKRRASFWYGVRLPTEGQGFEPQLFEVCELDGQRQAGRTSG